MPPAADEAKHMTKRLRRRLAWSLAAAASLAAGPLNADSKSGLDCKTDAMIVFDASGSMAMVAQDGVKRIDMARRALTEVLPEITLGRRAGLLTYSGVSNLQMPARCEGIAIRVPPMVNAAPAIIEALNNIGPAGLTPLTAAVEQAAIALKATEKRGVIVLVTDGIETCNRSPCGLARQLRATAKGLIVHVIGFFLGPDQAVHVACLADETGGLYVPAQSFEEMRRALRAVMRCNDIS